MGRGEGAGGTAYLFHPRKEYALGAGGVKSIGLPSNEDENDRQGQDHFFLVFGVRGALRKGGRAGRCDSVDRVLPLCT